MAERRQSPRQPVAFPIYLTTEGRCREERLVDVSATGAQLLSDARLRVGQAVKLFVSVTDPRGRPRTALVKGAVTRTVPGPRGRRGYGVRFQAGVRDTRGLLAAQLARC